jgi:hypothetical protein
MKKEIRIWQEGKKVRFETSEGWTARELLGVFTGIADELVRSDKIKVIYVEPKQNAVPGSDNPDTPGLRSGSPESPGC